MRKRQSHLPVYQFQNQVAADKDGNRRIFPLSVDAAYPAQRVSQNQELWFSPSVQQKAHHLSADGAACKAFQNDQRNKGTKKDHLSEVQGNHGDRLAENTETATTEAMFYINKERGIVM